MNRERLIVAAKILASLACLYLFIVGIGGMGHSFKLFGKDFADQILRTTSSPLISLFIGILATALVQSSSTTTSIIVGMVAGGAITIDGAIPMIMGANIGTTITNLLVSLGHITRGRGAGRTVPAQPLDSGPVHFNPVLWTAARTHPDTEVTLMLENLFNVFRKDTLFNQAIAECHQMLDLDWSMYEASVKSLREADSGEIALDVAAADKQINASERDVRKKVMTHLAVSQGGDLPSGLALITVVIDIERIGDYTKNIYQLARAHPWRLQAGSLEPALKEAEAGVTQIFRNMIEAFKTSNEDLARQTMVGYKEGLSGMAVS